MGFFQTATDRINSQNAQTEPFTQEQRDVTGLASGDAFAGSGEAFRNLGGSLDPALFTAGGGKFDRQGIQDVLDPGGFSSGDAATIAGRHGLSELLGFTQADAARQAAEDLKAATQEAQRRAAIGTGLQLETVGGAQDFALQQLQQGFGGARGALEGGLGEQQRLLGLSGQQFSPEAGLLSGLGDFQQGATAEGRAANLDRISGSRAFQDVLGAAERNTQNQLSSAGLRRSGAGAQIGNQLFLDTLLGFEAEERARTGGLIDRGSQATAQQANILQQQAAASGASGGALANLFQGGGVQTANLAERGGLSLADIIARGTQADIDLLGQAAQAQAGGTIGAGNAFTQGAGRGLEAVGTIGSFFSDPSLKKDVKRLGSHKGLGVYSWEWNDKAKAMYKLSGPGFGHMADEVEQMHPDLISRDENGIMKVNYGTDATVEAG